MVLGRGDDVKLFVEGKVAVGREVLEVADVWAALAAEEAIHEGPGDERRAWS